MKSIEEIQDLKGKKVLVRVDWNVPTENGVIRDDFRIKKSLETLNYLRVKGAKVLAATHFEGGEMPMDAFKKYLPSGVELLKNLRSDPGEEANSDSFAKQLAGKADIYVNEAFSASHREHASIVGVPKYLPSFAGIQLKLEVDTLSKAFYPKHPFLFVLGGAKFNTKLPILKKFLDIADHIFVGGALAHNFFKEQGKDIGASLVSEGDFGLKDILASGKILLPEDTITLGTMIMDAGPVTIENLKAQVKSSKMVLWNGPLGHYERGYKVSTLELAKVIADSGVESIVGGGDTVAAIKELDLYNKLSFVSTGGGAMLDFLSKGTLPGIEALDHSPTGKTLPKK